MQTTSATICCPSCFCATSRTTTKRRRRRSWARIIPTPEGDDRRAPLAIWYKENAEDIEDFEKQMRLKVHYVIEPQYLWSSIAEMARTQHNDLLDTLRKGFKYIEDEILREYLSGAVFGDQPALRKAWQEIRQIAMPSSAPSSRRSPRALPQFSTDDRYPGRCLRIPDRPVRRRLWQKGGRVLYPATDFHHPVRDRHTGQSGTQQTAKRKNSSKVLDFACGSGSLLLNVRKQLLGGTASARFTGRKRTSPLTTWRA